VAIKQRCHGQNGCRTTQSVQRKVVHGALYCMSGLTWCVLSGAVEDYYVYLPYAECQTTHGPLRDDRDRPAVLLYLRLCSVF
jgi:hypothetical protein